MNDIFFLCHITRPRWPVNIRNVPQICFLYLDNMPCCPECLCHYGTHLLIVVRELLLRALCPRLLATWKWIPPILLIANLQFFEIISHNGNTYRSPKGEVCDDLPDLKCHLFCWQIYRGVVNRIMVKVYTNQPTVHWGGKAWCCFP